MHDPGTPGPLPGVVLVDGAGDSTADGWGEQPATFGGCGAVVLTHASRPGRAHGVSVADQERYRIACAVNGDEEALAWVDERARRLLAGEDPASVAARQRAFAGRSWYELACGHYTPEMLPFFARIGGFDPAAVLPGVRCPVFAAFGGADTSVPVPRSVAVLSELLPGDPRHAIAVFPGADHGLMPVASDETTPYAARLAPGFLSMLTHWLAMT